MTPEEENGVPKRLRQLEIQSAECATQWKHQAEHCALHVKEMGVISEKLEKLHVALAESRVKIGLIVVVGTMVSTGVMSLFVKWLLDRNGA